MKMILILLFLSDFWHGITNLKTAKHLKKRITEKLMPIAWHSKTWWIFCMSEDEKKNEKEPIFPDIVKKSL